MALLEASDVSVRFGGLLALDSASLTVDEGCITGLIGPNGAGKTTCFNVITGLQHPTAGRVTLDGRDITDAKPHRRARLGIARTFQRLEAFGSLSARENVLVAAEMRRRWADDPMSPADIAQHTLERVGIVSVADVTVDALPTGTARLVELARALATKPRVLLLDEPSSGLDDDETDALGTSPARARRRRARHPPRRARHALRHGHLRPHRRARLRSRDRARHTERDPGRRRGADRLPRAREPTDEQPQRRPTLDRHGAPVLELRAVRAGYGRIDVLHGVDLRLMPAQVYALLGPNGAGKSTTLRVASGQIVPSSGTFALFGRTVNGVAVDALAHARRVRGARRPRHLPEPDRPREPAHGHLHRHAARRGARNGRSPGSRASRSGASRRPAHCRAASSRCSSMARALATNPAVLLIDELSMGLAPIVVEELYQHVANIARGRALDRYRRAVRTRDSRGRRRRGDHAPRPHPAGRFAGQDRRGARRARISAPTATRRHDEPAFRPTEETPMSEETAAGSEVMSSVRLSQFQDEVTKLKLKGGGANPERTGASWGIGLAIVGGIIVVIAWLSGKGGNTSAKLDSEVAAIIGLLVGLVGLALWLRNSLTRYLRYWLIRLIYEDREQTERLINAIEKLADKRLDALDDRPAGRDDARMMRGRSPQLGATQCTISGWATTMSPGSPVSSTTRSGSPSMSASTENRSMRVLVRRRRARARRATRDFGRTPSGSSPSSRSERSARVPANRAAAPVRTRQHQRAAAPGVDPLEEDEQQRAGHGLERLGVGRVGVPDPGRQRPRSGRRERDRHLAAALVALPASGAEHASSARA